jgi:hypothetical protein
MAAFSSFGETHILSFSASTLHAPAAVPATSISPEELFAMHVNGALATYTPSSLSCQDCVVLSYTSRASGVQLYRTILAAIFWLLHHGQSARAAPELEVLAPDA